MCVTDPLSQLDKEVSQIKCRAFAPGTRSNLQSQWKSYSNFCHDFRLQALPTTSTTLCRYIAFLCRSLKSYQSIKNYLHGVSVLHSMHSLPFVGLQEYHIKLMLLSVKKSLGNTPCAKLPLDQDILLCIAQRLDPFSSQDVAFWAATLIGFFGFLRKGNLVPPSASQFDQNRHLSRSNINRTSHGLVIHLTRTKTLQDKDSKMTLHIAAIDHPLDPVSAYERLITLVPAPLSAPAFVYSQAGHGLVSLTHRTYVQKLKALLSSCGIDPTLYSGHSLRRGGCSLAFRAGVATELIQSHGTWRSDCYQRYLAFSQAQSFSVTRAMGLALSSS